MPQLFLFGPRPRSGFRAAVFAVAVSFFVGAIVSAQSVEGKRPLKPADFDGWKSIQAPVLSRDGKFLAYDLFPQEGDGEVVVRNIASGAEHRVPSGRAAAVAAAPAEDPAAPAPPAASGRRRLEPSARLEPAISSRRT